MNTMTDTENNTKTPETVETPETPVNEAVTQEIAEETTPIQAIESEAEGEEPQTRAGMNWFVLRVASNKEDYVKAALDRKVEIEAMQQPKDVNEHCVLFFRVAR